MDSFGDISYSENNAAGTINPTGLVTRYFQSQTTEAKPLEGRTWIDGYSTTSEISGYQHLLNPDSEFYHDTYLRDPINEMNNQEYLDKYFNGNEDGVYGLSNLGHKGAGGSDYATHRALVNRGISPPEYGDYTNTILNTNMRNPVCLVVEPLAFSNFDNFIEVPILPDNPIKNIRYIYIKFRAEYQLWSGPYIRYDYMVPPVFDFSIGIISDVEEGADLKAKQIDVDNIDFKNNAQILRRIGDNARDSTLYPNGMGSIWKIGSGFAAGCSGFTDRYDSMGRLTSLNIDRGSIDTQGNSDEWHDIYVGGNNFKVTMNIEDKIEIPVDGLQIDSNSDTLLIKLKEFVEHSGVGDADENGGLGIHAGWNSYGGIGSFDDQHYATYDTINSQYWSNSPRQITPSEGEHTGFYSRYVIERFEIGFWNEEVDSIVELGNNNIGINFAWGDTDSEGVGWADRIFEIATTSINPFGEESALSSSSGVLGESTEGGSFIQPGQAPSIRFKMKEFYLDDIFITKTKVYMRDTESEIWFLQCYVDHEKRTFHSSTSFKSANAGIVNSLGEVEWFLERDNFKNFNEVASYESETMVSQDDGVSNNKLTARYKTSTIANNRMYVGNVMQDGVIHGDRMLKSPIGKYNILPASSFIDVAINDGDEITALAYYKDKILQFKKRKIFVINISGDYEFLEDTFDNVGVFHQASVTKTPYGIAWANKTGCYLYDGQQMTNLIDNKIPVSLDYASISNNYWSVGTTGFDFVLGYLQDGDTLLVKWSSDNVSASGVPEAATYHFPTKSWMFSVRSIAGNTGTGDSGAISNMITDVNGDILYYRFRSGTLTYNGIKKWSNAALGTGDNKIFYFTTKDFTFGDIINRKKIYKVYVTYKTTDGSDSKITLQAGTNSGSQAVAFSASASKFAGTSTACYHASDGLLDTGGAWKIAELKFTTPSTFNNIYSFQLGFLSLAADDIVFEINDMSIVFKTKRTK